MQSIKLVRYTRPEKNTGWIIDKYYSIYLTQIKFYFRSEKRLLAWIAKLNQHLTLILHDCNSITIELYSEYRYYFFHMNSADRKICNGCFRGLDKAFDHLFEKQLAQSDNTYTFHFMKVILNQHLEVLKILHRQSINKTNSIQRYRLSLLEQRILAAKKMFRTYPDGFDRKKVYDSSIMPGDEPIFLNTSF